MNHEIHNIFQYIVNTIEILKKEADPSKKRNFWFFENMILKASLGTKISFIQRHLIDSILEKYDGNIGTFSFEDQSNELDRFKEELDKPNNSKMKIWLIFFESDGVAKIPYARHYLKQNLDDGIGVFIHIKRPNKYLDSFITRNTKPFNILEI